MELYLTIILFCVVFTIISEFATHTTYGKFLNDQEVFDYLKRYESFSLNPFDHSIVSGDIDYKNVEQVLEKLRNGDFISTTPLSLFSKYYISGIGRVFAWSKGTKEIDKVFKTSKQKYESIN